MQSLSLKRYGSVATRHSELLHINALYQQIQEDDLGGTLTREGKTRIVHKMKSDNFYDVTPSSPTEINRRFQGKFYIFKVYH